MPKKGRKTTPSISPAMMTATLLTGALVAFGVCGLGLALSAGLVLAGRLGEDAVTRCCCVSLGIGCFIGGLYTALSCKVRMLAASLGAGLITVAFFAAIGFGCFGGIAPPLLGTNLLAAALGSGLAGLVSVRH
ncbi:MAG: hypothetical protein MJ077_01870 [Oscillospiraceae bacterium]|nr:hypothetical protein [Oscillospiraceae bacterium]